MYLEDLQVNCPDCDSWYSYKEVDFYKWNKEEESGADCPRCGGELQGSGEAGLQTPAQYERAQFVKHQIAFYEGEIKRLQKYLWAELGDDYVD